MTKECESYIPPGLYRTFMATADVMPFSFFHPRGWAWPKCLSQKPTTILNSMEPYASTSYHGYQRSSTF